MAKYWLDPSFERGLVSVIIPCHNEERFLSACLESVNKQEYRPLEIIIVDDGSTDGTRKIMNEFQSSNLEKMVVKCIFQQKQGAQHARNQGCQQARGEFIQFLDGDDVLLPGKLSGQVAILNNDKSIDVIYGDGQYIITGFGEEEIRLGRIISRGSAPDIIESFLSGAWVPAFAYLSRRSAIQRCGPWDITIQINQDFDYFLRMALIKCKYFYSEGITGYYRKHSLNTISEQSILLRGKNTEKILSKAERMLIDEKEFNENRLRATAEYYRRLARQVYSVDKEYFNYLLNHVLRLCPKFHPKKLKARLITSVIGFQSYEVFAAIMSRFLYSNKEKSWF